MVQDFAYKESWLSIWSILNLSVRYLSSFLQLNPSQVSMSCFKPPQETWSNCKNVHNTPFRPFKAFLDFCSFWGPSCNYHLSQWWFPRPSRWWVFWKGFRSRCSFSLKFKGIYLPRFHPPQSRCMDWAQDECSLSGLNINMISTAHNLGWR